jgi:hypothetical protein
MTVDVSRRGACCATKQELETEGPFRIELDVPGRGPVQLGLCAIVRKFPHDVPLPFDEAFPGGVAVMFLEGELQAAGHAERRRGGHDVPLD